MIDHYDAFISYKHGELDSKIAERVQHKLEHFHIPGKIAKRTGKKKITRIFRDKEELPITSNLTDTISYALEHSDYLIVICSTRTKLSTWVTREIKVFLETHPRNRVLTVLCDGEPGDVIPEELLYEEHEVTDDNGTVHKVKVPLEPLSCDYRMSFRKADKEELPRLAAPIIGCSYDELMRRRRVYRIQRAAAVGSAVLAAAIGFGFYMYHSKKEVQRHYEDSLRSRAQYYSSESLRLYEDDEVVKALQLALAAVPSEENPEMPVTSSGIRALTKATGAYMPKLSSLSYKPEWNYTMSGKIKKMEVSSEGYYLAGGDEIGNIKCWDTYSHKETFSSQDFLNFGFPNEDILIILTEEKMIAVSTEDGRVVWENVPEYITDSDDVSRFTDNSNKFDGGMLEFRDNYVYTMLANGTIVKIDLNTGERVYTSDYDFDSPTTKYFASVNQASISPDGKKVAISLESGGAGLENRLVVYDFETSEYISAENVYESELDLTWCGNDNILISTLNNFYGMTTANVLREHTIYLANYDPQTCKEKWTLDYKHYAENRLRGKFYHPEGSDSVVYCVGKNLANIDLETGEVINSFICSDDIVSVFDDGGSSVARIITSDGQYGICNSDDSGEFINVFQCFSINIDKAVYNYYGVYTVEFNDNIITCYRNDVYDRNWTCIGHQKDKWDDLGLSINKYVYGDTLLIESYERIKNPVDDKTQHYTLTVIDQNAGEVIDKFDLDGSFFDYYGLVKVDEYCYIFSNVDYDAKILKFDLDKGKVVDEFDACDESLYSLQVNCTAERFFYPVKDTNRNACIRVFDPATEKFEDYALNFEYSSLDLLRGMYITDDGQKMLFTTSDGKAHILDMEKNKIKTIEFDDGFQYENAYINNDYICMANKETVKIFSLKDYKEISSIECGQLGPRAFYEQDGILYIVFESDLLGKYKIDDGSLLDITELNFGFETVDIEFIVLKDKLLIDNHIAAAVIDTNEFVQTEVIYYFLSYHEGTNRYYDYSNHKSMAYKIGYFDCYTVEDLVKKAKDMLDGAELSDEDKARYGI